MKTNIQFWLSSSSPSSSLAQQPLLSQGLRQKLLPAVPILCSIPPISLPQLLGIFHTILIIPHLILLPPLPQLNGKQNVFKGWRGWRGVFGNEVNLFSFLGKPSTIPRLFYLYRNYRLSYRGKNKEKNHGNDRECRK